MMRTLRPYRALRLAERRLERVYACYERQRLAALAHPGNDQLGAAARDLAVSLYGSRPAIERRK